MIAALKGYRMKLLMPDNMSQERRAAMRATVRNSSCHQRAGHGSARDLRWRWRIVAKESCSIQFNKPDNPYAHYTTTGPEIWQQTGGRITHFCLQHGHNRHYHRRFTLYARTIETSNDCRPATGRRQQYSGIRRWPAEYLPGIFNASLVDEVLDIHQRDAENTMRELAVREGIFCGVSSGGAVAGALRVAKANPGAVVVAIICDRGDRYLSTGVFGEEHFSQGAGI
ncbi:pyridoxal-phosphate dependent enzyme [Escherichia coli]